MPVTVVAAYTYYFRRNVPDGSDGSALASWLEVELNTVQRAIPFRTTKTVSANYTLTTVDDIVLVDCTNGAVTITLAAAYQVQHGTWTIKKIDASVNVVTISSPLGSTIDGAATATISRQYATISLRSDGNQFYQFVYPSISAPSTVGTLTFGTHLQASGSSFNGSANVTIATDATSNNTINTIVARDGSGNFSAGSITGTALNSSGAITLTTNNTFFTAMTSGGSTVALMGLTNDASNITRFRAGVDAGGFQWTNQAASAGWLSLTSTTLTGNTINATTLGGTLSTAAQPNVTSLGTLTGLTVSGSIQANGGVVIAGTNGSSTPGQIAKNSAVGLAITGITGSVYDVNITDPSGADILHVPTGTKNIVIVGSLTAASLVGTLTTASQPNVTSVGTLTGLTVGGTATVNTLVTSGSAALNPMQLNGDSVGQGMQIKMGSTNVTSTFGSTYSGGYNFMAANAFQTTAATDSWTQAFASARSLLYVQDYTLGHVWYNAAAGISPATKAAFWGSPLMSISPAGAVAMASTLAVTGVLTGSADIKLATVGSGYYAKEGTNATMGVATLSTGTIVVATTKVTASSRIFVSRQDDPSALGVLPCDVTARVVGTSFTIKSSNPLDNATVAWIIFEPS